MFWSWNILIFNVNNPVYSSASSANIDIIDHIFDQKNTWWAVSNTALARAHGKANCRTHFRDDELVLFFNLIAPENRLGDLFSGNKSHVLPPVTNVVLRKYFVTVDGVIQSAETCVSSWEQFDVFYRTPDTKWGMYCGITAVAQTQFSSWIWMQYKSEEPFHRIYVFYMASEKIWINYIFRTTFIFYKNLRWNHAMNKAPFHVFYGNNTFNRFCKTSYIMTKYGYQKWYVPHVNQR